MNKETSAPKTGNWLVSTENKTDVFYDYNGMLFGPFTFEKYSKDEFKLWSRLCELFVEKRSDEIREASPPETEEQTTTFNISRFVEDKGFTISELFNQTEKKEE